jgi:hypothetical protein
MASSLDLALQRSLAIRLNLQISLSSLPIVEEWMDIHLDRWLEHNPMPPDMPNGQAVQYSVMLGTDLRRMWWGAWGDPRGFVPHMADYFKLCNIDKSDAAVLDQLGVALEPTEVGSWIAVWGGKVVTGWHFTNAHPWSKVEPAFGTHEAKYQLKKWVEDNRIERIERFTQSIGDASYSEIELAVPGTSMTEQVEAASSAFAHFTGAPLEEKVRHHLLQGRPGAGLVVRIRGGRVVRVAVMVPGLSQEIAERLSTIAGCIVDGRFSRVCNAVGEGLTCVAYGRAGNHAGVDVFLEPTEPKKREPSGDAGSAASTDNGADGGAAN